MLSVLPETSVARFGGSLDHLFDALWRTNPAPFAWEWPSLAAFPALNVWEEDDRLHVEAELPGLKIEDLELSVKGDELTLKGQRRAETPKDTAYHRRERTVGQFTRVVRLPVAVDAQAVQASLKDGVLTITLPKAEAAKPRKIVVKG